MTADYNFALPVMGTVIGLGFGLTTRIVSYDMPAGLGATIQTVVTLGSAGLGGGLGLLLNYTLTALSSYSELLLDVSKIGAICAISYKALSCVTSDRKFQLAGVVGGAILFSSI